MSFQWNFCIWVFFVGVWKKLLPFSKWVPLNFSICKDSWYFRTGIRKSHCHIWNLRSRIYLVAKSGAKIKIFIFGTKNAWFGYFWAGIWKYFCLIWNQHPRICLLAKFDANKNPKIWGQKCLVWVFLGWSLKRILSYLKSARSSLSNCKTSWKNEFS